MAKKELVLATATKRRTVTIDGVKIPMLGMEEVKLDAGIRIRLVRESFMNKERLTEEGAVALAARLVRTVRDIMPTLPKEIDDKLSDSQRIDIMIAFFQATTAPASRTASGSPARS